LHARHLLDVEVAQVFRRHVAQGAITASRAEEALQDLLDLRLLRYPHGLLLPRAWELRDNLTAYDAVYVALAEALDATLLTCDRKLASAPGHHARIEII
jgi:predicted nucleic acid-binding protein